MSLLQKKRIFPQYQELGTDVYDVDNKIFRDNSKFVTACANNNTDMIFTRPPQLSTTTLLSLAELLLSNTKIAPTGLQLKADQSSF